jgi:hypothetical protein
MPNRVRPYLFYDVAVSICTTCYRKVVSWCPEDWHPRTI